MAKLVEAIDLLKLTQDGTEFKVDADFVDNPDTHSDDEEIKERTYQHLNKECIGIFDEDVYEEGEPFEIISKRMVNLTPDGKIKKRVIREGKGEKPTPYGLARIHYNAYVEHEDEPFDSTYVRNKPLKIVVGDGRVIAGLDFAVQNMKLGEKSQFLIHPDYAYGKNCNISRIPPNATVLFEIEVLDVINSGAAVTYERLPEEEQKLFSEVYKYCNALNERAKRYFKEHEYKKAIIDYNTAAAKLEKVTLNNKEDKEKHRELLLKFYSNLLICYTCNNQPRKGCSNAKKIYDFTENGELLKISAKVYFNHAKCLRILGEYNEAKIYIDKAYKLEPKNPDIANEIMKLENEITDQKNKQMAFAKALIGKSP